MRALPGFLAAVLLILSACGGHEPAPVDLATLEVTDHFVEVPRIPYPGYHRDGVVIAAMDGETAWSRAGLQVGDIIESVNGTGTYDTETFRKTVEAVHARGVRIRSSRTGAYGFGRVLELDLVR